MKRIELTNKAIGQLTVLYPTEKRKHGSVVWHCLCDCGNEVEYSYNELIYTNIISCGCVKKENSQNLCRTLTHICGTSVNSVSSRKIPTNNSTGCRGVYLINGKYVAKIVFRKKQYYVGTYNNYEDAVLAREEAEHDIFDTFCEAYRKWQLKEDEEPGWCAQNPLNAEVIKTSGKLILKTYPEV